MRSLRPILFLVFVYILDYDEVTMYQFKLKKGKEIALTSRHPWIFSGAFEDIHNNIPEGALIRVVQNDGCPLCYGHYQTDSIAVKVLKYGEIDSENDLIAGRLTDAFLLRKTMGLVDNRETNAYRLVHGEGDFLPGLIIDIYNRTAVLQCHSAGMTRLADVITQSLRDIFGPALEAVYEKPLNEKSEGRYLYGQKNSAAEIREHGLKFIVDWEQGQKTGFYLDQRENRNLLRSMSAGKKILNAFCYTGAFSVYALAGGASSVTSVDSSERALEMAGKNVEVNFEKGEVNHSTVAADCLKYLKEMNETYDVIVIDPPAFIKHRGAFKGGVNGYRSINSSAIAHLNPGGILLTFSCSQLLGRKEFEDVVRGCALDSKKDVRILCRLAQSPCHPVSINHPEGEYLKGLVVQIEGDN